MKASTLKTLENRLECLNLEYDKRGRDLKINIARDLGKPNFERNTINELCIMEDLHAEIFRLKETIELLKALEKIVY